MLLCEIYLAYKCVPLEKIIAKSFLMCFITSWVFDCGMCSQCYK